MTRRDYEVIAEIIVDNNRTSSYTEHDTLELARFFSVALKRDNPKFNHKIFLDYVKERM